MVFTGFSGNCASIEHYGQFEYGDGLSLRW